LLVAYPRAYRRDRGEELVDTLLEAAPLVALVAGRPATEPTGPTTS
jgi:hypothetical protein